MGRLDPSKQFDFSEIYIFGKYENFVKRVSNINELLNTIKIFSALKKCHIEVSISSSVVWKSELETS